MMASALHQHTLKLTVLNYTDMSMKENSQMDKVYLLPLGVWYSKAGWRISESGSHHQRRWS